MEETLERVHASLPDNEFAQIADGRLKLSKDDKTDIPASAEALKRRLRDLLPPVKPDE